MEILTKMMKASAFLVILCFLCSCKKDEGVGTVGIAKVNVINAVVDGGNFKANISKKTIPWGSIPDDKVLGGFSLSRLYTVPTDEPTFVQVSPIADTTKLWFDQQKQLSAGKIYTLYLSGTSSNVKASFQEEVNFPKYILRDLSHPTPSTDSIVNIRFANLSPSGPQVDINIQGKSINEVNGLSYESFTAFKAYPATTGNDYIILEIRKSSDKQLINTFYLYVPNVRFKSISIIMMGIYPGDGLSYNDKYKIDYITYQ
ncbi:hypothetical protein [Sphingobacterium sp. UBA6320]|uniref:hypothetical protein n=1 Tax=Sphingobacterium sp. UBA6320 TaxID=1947510 RepID=UPI0025E0F34B|nr:hypothetical protein [Sphingobacterium sp. UBA6320]